MSNFRHRMHGSHAAGDIWISGFYSTSGQTLAVMHAAFVTWAQSVIGTLMAPLWDADTSLDTLETDLLVTGGYKNSEQLTTGQSIAGTATSAMLSPSAAVVIGLRTALPTRAGRGRMYLPAPTSASLAATGLLLLSAQESISSGVAAAFSTFASTGTPVVFHSGRATSTQPAVPSTVTPVTEISVGQVLGNISRRVNKIPANYQYNVI